jgi:hypothetical protein
MQDTDTTFGLVNELAAARIEFDVKIERCAARQS